MLGAGSVGDPASDCAPHAVTFNVQVTHTFIREGNRLSIAIPHWSGLLCRMARYWGFGGVLIALRHVGATK